LTRARDVADSALVHIATESFTSASTASLNNVFTSDYDNYNVKIELTAVSADSGLRFRYRASGTDNTGTYLYGTPAINYLNTTSNSYSGAGSTSHQFGTADAGTSGHFYYADIMINSPAIATATLHTLNFTAVLTAGGQVSGAGGGWHNVASAFDGITFFPTSGTFSGKVWVYGYRK
jgi:hypothetical protein